MAVLPIDELKKKIDSNIYQNSQQAITGARMNTILNDMADSLDETETLDALSKDLVSAAQGVQTNAENITANAEAIATNKTETDAKLTELEEEVGFYPRPGLIANGKWYDTINGRHLLIPISSQDIITVNPKTASYYTLLSDYTNAVDGESAMFATGYTDRIVMNANKDIALFNSDAKYLYLALGANLNSLVEYNTISINGNDIKGYISNAWALSLATKTSALNQRIEDISNPLNRFLFTNHYYLIANGKWNSYNFGAKCSIISIIPSDKITITPNAAAYYSLLRSYNQPLSDTDVVDFASGYSDRVSFDKEISFVASEDANYLYIADIAKINSIKINDIDVTSIYNNLDMLQHPNIGKIAPYLTTGIPNANNEMWYDANSSHMVIDVQSGSIIDLIPNEGKSIYYFFFREYISPVSPASTHPILSEECVGQRPFTYNERVSLVVPYDAKYLYIHAINTSNVKDILINGVSVYNTTMEQVETVRKKFTSMESIEYKSSIPMVNYYPNILDKCPKFRDKLANMENDLTILILGDSLSAMHRNKQTDAKNMPCQMTRYTWDYWMWKYTNNSDVIGRRYDSGVFTEVGAFSSGYTLFADGLPLWSRDENDDASITRYSTDAAASVTFMWDLPLYEKCHFIHRMDVRGCSSVKISIKEGNGRVRVFNGESWVEANGFEFSQYINPQEAFEGSGKSQTLANWRLKFKKESQNGTATITISKNVADSSYFFYWGYEMWNGNRLIFVNNAHGGRECGYFKNHMLSFKNRKPDLVICQNMLINEYSDAIVGDNGNNHSGQTIVNNAWDMIYGDRQGNENALSLQSISNNWEDFEVINIIPHFRYEYFNKDEVSFKTTFDNGYVDMTCWKVWEKVKNLHISKGKAVIDISKVWKNEALMRGWTHRQSYANAGFETNTNAGWESLDGFTYDTVHQNTYGHRIWAKYISTIFD
jgi:hypothetical protein